MAVDSPPPVEAARDVAVLDDTIVVKRQHLGITRASITHKFSLSGNECYFTIGMFEDGSPGELFITMSKNGSTMAGLMDTIGLLTSLSLQFGVPLHQLATKLRGTVFEPSEPDKATSLIDYIFTWLDNEFPDGIHKDGPPVIPGLGPREPSTS